MLHRVAQRRLFGSTRVRRLLTSFALWFTIHLAFDSSGFTITRILLRPICLHLVRLTHTTISTSQVGGVGLPTESLPGGGRNNFSDNRPIFGQNVGNAIIIY